MKGIKKHSTKLIKDTHGMSLMELVVALTLLALVIVGTTPIMLSSYEGLYTAGEYTKETYDAKSEIEDTLAKRTSLDVYNGFKVNFQNLGEVATINGKRAVSSLYGSLESLFVGGRAHLTIISSDVINDDYLEKEIVLQTTNIGFNSKNDIMVNDASTVTDGQKLIDITVMLPDKTKSIISQVYTKAKEAQTVVKEANADTGRIRLTIQGLDFTNSPARIEVTYRDENNKVKKIATYLTVKTPTIMLAGTTVYGHYYTTEGVVTKTDLDGSETQSFQVDSRTMTMEQATFRDEDVGYSGFGNTKNVYIRSLVRTVPEGTIFKNITWVDNDESKETSTSTSQLEPYFVLTGNNSSIYRTYSFTGEAVDFRKNLLRTEQVPFILTDSPQQTQVYPALWGGDYSYQFGYSTHGLTMAYQSSKGSETAWYTGDGGGAGLQHSQATAYGTKTTVAYYYNGWGMTYNYHSQRRRPISYILTETGYSLRMGGWMGSGSDFDKAYNKIWENADNENISNDNRNPQASVFGDDVPMLYHGEYNKGETPTKGNFVPYYLGDNTTGNAAGSRFRDANFAQINLKYLSTLSKDFIMINHDNSSIDALTWDNVGGAVRWQGDEGQDASVFINEQGYDNSNVNITDAVYIPYVNIPGVSDEYNPTGKMFYTGSTAAYGFLNQIDNMGPDSAGNPISVMDDEGLTSGDFDSAEKNWGALVYWQSLEDWDEISHKPAFHSRRYHTKSGRADNYGRTTSYYFCGSDDGFSTEVYKYSIDAGSHNFDDQVQPVALPLLQYVRDTSVSTLNKIKTNTDESREFFVTRSNATATGTVFTDLYFTIGYASNRSLIYPEITYGRLTDGSVKESYKSYEHYYFLSHYGISTHKPTFHYMSQITNASKTEEYLNSVNNDYYNVWMPGEMYNITKIATKDGVTVGVGYAVSGSTYQFINPNDADGSNTSTALGGLNNDGILACMVGGVDASMKNLLYFKDNTTADLTSLTDGSISYYQTNTYKNLWENGDLSSGNYGTHARDSVQFLCVDIGIEYTQSGATENAVYYAYYADNKGRLFKSKIATKSSSAAAEGTPQKVSYISDQPVNEAPTESYSTTASQYSAPTASCGYMNEVTVNGNSLSYYFSKITSIKCEGDLIVVTGHPNTARGAVYIVVGEVVQNEDKTANTYTWSAITVNANGLNMNCQAEVSLTLDGYFYFAGARNDGSGGGFVVALSLDDLKRARSSSVNAYFVSLKDKIYAMDGHM